MKSSLFILLLSSLLFCTSSFAQTTNEEEQRVSSRSVFVELGGNGLIVTFNFDARFNPTAPDGLGIRAGFGGFLISDFGGVTFPLLLNYLGGNNGNYFEGGAGITYSSFGWYGYNDQGNVLGTLSFGYRYQPVKGGFMLRAAITPFFGSEDDSPFFFPFYGGLSLGYAF